MDILDSPIWNALHSVHASFGEGNALARRYRPTIGPLAATRDQSAEAYAALGRLIGPDGLAVLFLEAPPVLPPGWRIVATRGMEQMVCSGAPVAIPHEYEIVTLGDADTAAMRALAELTEPGPFRDRTIELGGYVGVRDGERLVAMTGQRTAVPGYTEVSAVCTHPDYRGRGYAAALVSAVAGAIVARGGTPFLGVRPDNVGAIRVYARVGFTIRRRLQFAAVMPPSVPD